MRTVNAILLFVLAAAPLRAQTPAISAFEACKKLVAQAAKLTSEKVRCEAAAGGLVLAEASPAARKALEALFPERTYLGHAIVEASAPAVRTSVLPSPVVIKAQELGLEAAQ